jgi:hypothetical protein
LRCEKKYFFLQDFRHAAEPSEKRLRHPHDNQRKKGEVAGDMSGDDKLPHLGIYLLTPTTF